MKVITEKREMPKLQVEFDYEEVIYIAAVLGISSASRSLDDLNGTRQSPRITKALAIHKCPGDIPTFRLWDIMDDFIVENGGPSS